MILAGRKKTVRVTQKRAALVTTVGRIKWFQ